MNEYDTDRIFDFVKKIDYEKTENPKTADCYLINTCHIREKATEKVYHDVGRIKKNYRNKNKPIVIIAGCVAQAEGEVILQNDRYIDAVIGPQSYHELAKIIKGIEKKRDRINLTEFETIKKFDQINLIRNYNSKISSYLTIQEGCDKFCKFCVVPYTRGPELSRSSNDIIDETKLLVDNGTKEITLLGQNVNAYLFNNKRLSDLIIELEKLEGLKRIRYTTSHPIDMTDDLIDVHGSSKKLMPLLHLPIQSGSNKILKEMNRKHTVEDYIEKIEKLKQKKSNIKFSSDFIIAYPGETKKDFNDTLRILKKIEFINTYSFNFSPRPGTPADSLKLIKTEDAKKRLKTFQGAAENIKINYRKSLIGKKVKVLFENKISKNQYFGRDEFFNSVIVSSNSNLTGGIFETKIISFNHRTLFGSIFNENKKKNFAA